MATLLKWFGGWFAGFSVATFLAKVFSFVVVITISATVADSLIGYMFNSLQGFGGLAVLQLGGVTEMLGIVSGAVVFRIAATGFTGLRFTGGS